MAFTVTKDQVPNVIGDKKSISGTFVNDAGSTGGDIVLTFTPRVVLITHDSATVVANSPAYQISGNTVTFVTDADTSGSFMILQ